MSAHTHQARRQAECDLAEHGIVHCDDSRLAASLTAWAHEIGCSDVACQRVEGGWRVEAGPLKRRRLGRAMEQNEAIERS